MKRITALLLVFCLSVSLSGCKVADYKRAMELYNQEYYDEALAILEPLGEYKDSQDLVLECKYGAAVDLMENGEYLEAREVFCEITDFKDSAELTLECGYRQAIEFMENEEYAEARGVFRILEGYKDSATKLDECGINIYGEETWNRIANLGVGDIISFGRYEQDGEKSGIEAIEWIVLAKEEMSVLVISRYILECMPYQQSTFIDPWSEDADITWDNCTLRAWLNGTFYESAFSSVEQAMIGESSQGRVFLLSVEEAEAYLSSRSYGSCDATEYAIANGANEDRWWLRTSGKSSGYVACYNSSYGYVDKSGSNANSYSGSVRPAMWIDLNG